MSSDVTTVVEPTFGLLYIIAYEGYGGYVLWGGYVPRSKWWLRSVLEDAYVAHHSSSDVVFTAVMRPQGQQTLRCCRTPLSACIQKALSSLRSLLIGSINYIP